MLDVGADATINMQVDTYERYAMSADHLIDASSGSQLVNNGDINLRSIGFAAITGEDSFGSNTGNLTLSVPRWAVCKRRVWLFSHQRGQCREHRHYHYESGGTRERNQPWRVTGF